LVVFDSFLPQEEANFLPRIERFYAILLSFRPKPVIFFFTKISKDGKFNVCYDRPKSVFLNGRGLQDGT